MPATFADIASFSGSRESVLIGPRAAFGREGRRLLLRDFSAAQRVVERLIREGGGEAQLRLCLLRWGIDTSALRERGALALARIVAGQVEAGRIGIAIVPEPTLTLAGQAGRREAQLREACAYAPSGRQAPTVTAQAVATDAIPPELEKRFVIVIGMAIARMDGEAKREIEALIDSVGLGMIAGGLLMWIGAHFVPGANLAMLAFDLFFLSEDVIRAVRKIAEAIRGIAAAQVRSDLEPIAQSLAAALAVLVINGLLRKFARGGRVVRGPIASTGAGKPRLPRTSRQKADRLTVMQPTPLAAPARMPPPGPGLSPAQARRAQLNEKFGRTGNLDEDMNTRGRREAASGFFRRQGVPEDSIPGYLSGIDFSKPVQVQTIGKGRTLYQYQAPGAPQGNWYSPKPDVTPDELGISHLGENRALGTIEPKVRTGYRTTQRVETLRSTAAPVIDKWSVRGQVFPTKGGGTQLFTTAKDSIPQNP